MLAFLLLLPIASLASFSLGQGHLSSLAFRLGVPWSLASVLLAHVSFEHLYTNLQAFTIYGFAILFSTVFLAWLTGSLGAAWRLSWGCLTAGFLPHIVILLFQGWLHPQASFYGMSLVVFSLYGYGFTLTLYLSIFIFTAAFRRVLGGFSLLLASLLAGFLLLLFLIPLTQGFTFFGLGKPQANVAGHVAASLGGAITGSAFLKKLISQEVNIKSVFLKGWK